MNESTGNEMNRATTASREENRGRWQGLVAEQRTSGESKRAFCRGRGISYPCFLHWSKRFAEDEGAVPAGTFCELRVGAPAAFEVQAGGVVVRVGSGFDEGELARLLRAVFEASRSLGESTPSFGGAVRPAVNSSRPAGEATRPC
jgi:hypothetical protein